MLTIFSLPKPFSGPSGDLQRTAVASWAAIDGAQVVLLGEDDGIAEAAAAAGVEHGGPILVDDGTPRLDDAFAVVARLARHPLLCYVNADVVLGDDLVAALGALREERFLLVGQTLELDPEEVRGRPFEAVRAAARSGGTARGAAAIDYFVFTPGLFDPLPPFVVGRAGFDNWLIWRARSRGVVVDASDAVVAVHQRHDYGHLPGGKQAAYYGPEAMRNLRLAGGSRHIYTLHDASHRLTPDLTLRRNYGAILRTRETIRKIGWKLGLR